MSSTENAKSSMMIKTQGGDHKRDKHAFHVMYGCKRSKCTICYYGQPMQMLVNQLGGKNV